MLMIDEIFEMTSTIAPYELISLAKNISAIEWGLLCNYHAFM